MSIELIVGLRNPGSVYADTRHNAGAWFVEALLQQYPASLTSEKKMQGEVANFSINAHCCHVLLPLTFMNHSGMPVQKISQFYKIPIEHILVVHDDLDLPAGSIKLKTGGGHGGHNGLRDIITQCGSAAFHRLRIGIAHPGHKDLVLNYVLGKPSQPDKACIRQAIEDTLLAVPLLVTDTIARAMTRINTLRG